MNITTMFDPGQLQTAIDEGYVRTQRHPELPLVIYNYTEKAQYEYAWNTVTMQCRGLIVDDDGEVVARPFPKFFNYGDTGGDVSPSYYHSPVVVTDKVDGSLGILWRYADTYGIATRGSFTSPQAAWATKWFNKYAEYSAFDFEYTYLFEILASWNRIVVDYDWEGLVLLGRVNIEYGFSDNNIPEDPWVLQTRTPRDDSGEHLR